MATYEDSDEAKFLKKVFQGRASRDLENTVFALLAPDGRTKLSRAARSPHMVYGSAARLTDAMNTIAKRYPAKEVTKPQRLPQMKNYRLAINVAACDGLPILVGYASQKKDKEKLEVDMSQLAFNEELAGKLHFYATSNRFELASIEGFKGRTGYYLLGPGKFGTSANFAEYISPTATAEDKIGTLTSYVMLLDKEFKSHREHVNAGLRNGIDWQTEVPVTDRMSAQARKRADKYRAKKK